MIVRSAVSGGLWVEGVQGDDNQIIDHEEHAYDVPAKSPGLSALDMPTRRTWYADQHYWGLSRSPIGGGLSRSPIGGIYRVASGPPRLSTLQEECGKLCYWGDVSAHAS
eukprot:3712514-Amphidinium_carterae.1